MTIDEFKALKIKDGDALEIHTLNRYEYADDTQTDCESIIFGYFIHLLKDNKSNIYRIIIDEEFNDEYFPDAPYGGFVNLNLVKFIDVTHLSKHYKCLREENEITFNEGLEFVELGGCGDD